MFTRFCNDSDNHTAFQGDIQWEELNDDPATVACKELLSRLDEEEEQEETSGTSNICALLTRFFAQLHKQSKNSAGR